MLARDIYKHAGIRPSDESASILELNFLKLMSRYIHSHLKLIHGGRECVQAYCDQVPAVGILQSHNLSIFPSTIFNLLK